MIDWGKVGPANAPSTQATVTTTAPITPPASGGPDTSSLFGNIPTGSNANSPYQTGVYHEATQAQVDAMDPATRFARGVDFLGNTLFGQGNGSPLGGVPLLGDILGAAGKFASGVGSTALTVGVKPIEAGATVLSHIPLGWVPGGADDAFTKIGDWAKVNDPKLYAQWQTVDAAAGKDILYGGNMKADFNMETAKYLDDQHYESSLGSTPDLAMSREGVGSLGGALSHAIQGFLGVGTNTVQEALSSTGIFDPYYRPGTTINFLMNVKAHPDAYTQSPGATAPYAFNDFEKYAVDNVTSGKWTQDQAQQWIDQNINSKLGRLQESASRLDAGMEVSPIEKQAVEAWRSGAWSEQHAKDYLVTHGAGITRNPIGQAFGTVMTDPITWATLGAGGISGLGAVGVRGAEAAGLIEKAAEGSSLAERIAVGSENASRIAASIGSQESTYAKLATTVAAVQKSPYLGPAFRFARGMIDPFAVYKPSSVMKASQDLLNGAAIKAFDNTYGQEAIQAARSIAREAGVTPEVDSAIASYSMDKAHEMVAQSAQHNMLNEGLGEELVNSGLRPDDLAPTLAGTTGTKDAVVQLTDHMTRVKKVTFTAEEDATLAGRLSKTFGKDVPYWENAMKGMAKDTKSALHAITHKTAEVDLSKTLAKIDPTLYKGDLPLDRLVLTTADTLDDQVAKSIIQNIRDMLKNEAEPERIASATAEWNAQARRYPMMDNIGYATGGKEQVETLVKQLEKELESGGITRRVTEEELSDPALTPLRDFLDRNSVPSGEFSVKPAPKVTTRYHGSPQTDLTSAAASPGTRQFDNATSQFGAFTTTSREAAAKYAGKTGKVYGTEAELANPYKMTRKMFDYFQSPNKAADGATLDASQWAARAEELKAEAAKLRAELVAKGHDGIEIPGNKGNPPETAHFADVALGDVVEDPQAVYQRLLAEHEANIAKYKQELADWKAGGEVGKPPELVKTTAPVPPGDPAIAAAAEPATVEGTKRLWNLGFRPDEEVAWGLKREGGVGRWMVDRAPTISHVMDAVPGRQPFSDTTRNVLGQIIGKSAAERINGPIDSIEAFINTNRDIVTGRRLVMNIEQRFEKSTFDAGIPKSISRDIMSKAKESSALDATTLRGVKPGNLWNSIAEMIPRDLRLADGSTLNVHIVMDHLLQAAEGDLRVMGVTSNLSQRVRNALRKLGDGSNWAGQMTVTMYNKLRFSQPMFLIQRITDAPYYSILYGVTPVGRGVLSESNQALKLIMDNLGRTGLARDFSMDMPEYALRSQFTQGIKSALQQSGVDENLLQRIATAPDVFITNNMVNMMHARLGDVVRGALKNAAKAAAKASPEMKAELIAAGSDFEKSFEDLRQVYSNIAGHVVDDNELGQMYISDMLTGWQRHVVNPDGTLDFQRLVAEGERSMPNDIADIGPIRPDLLAKELGYADAAALRRDVVGSVKRVNGEFTIVKGEHDIPWLEEALRTQMRAHPDYVKRAAAYFGGTWDDFWYNLSRPLEKGGLDISPHYAKEAQAAIAGIAKERGMDPWEYLSGVMQANLGPQDLDTAMGRFVNFLKGGADMKAPGDWGSFYRSHLDPSAQDALMKAYSPAGHVPNAPVPDGFHSNANIIASGHTFPTEIKREGIFHVTTQRDAVMKEGFKSGATEGFGSAGDATLAGRVSVLTDRARSQAYMDRILLAGKAARGEADPTQIADAFIPVYKRGFGDQYATEMANAAGALAAKDTLTPEEAYLLVQRLDAGLTGGTLTAQDRLVKLTAPFETAKGWKPDQISMLELAAKDKAIAKKGIDTAELTLAPEDLVPLGTGAADTSKFFDEGIIPMLQKRVADGPHENADVEGAIQQVAKLTQSVLKGTPAEGMTRTQLRELVEAIPTAQAVPFNRTHALTVQLLKAKLEEAQRDVFRLAEMQTQRTVLERSLNHPLFGLYPSSYMWGKVLPETVKFLAKNPYAATYTIANVQRAIAIQREYDPNMDQKVGSVDRSAGAFLIDYMTPGLPWSDQSARMSPVVRDLFGGKGIGAAWKDELATVSPERWVKQFVSTANELPSAIGSFNQQPAPPFQSALDKLAGGASSAPSATAEPQTITGPTKASALAPILSDDLSRLQSIFLGGQSAAP